MAVHVSDEERASWTVTAKVDTKGASEVTASACLCSEILIPKNTWENKEKYDNKANELADAFNKNFSQFAEFANEEILDAVPKATIRS